ncbi:hypothetical protein [Plebeiibacterium sediminum]|uniref:Uncharacterized protein n=1 Tax=Plebeiibacterium sediminum TaxID=2992112 RepID=A0AAE3M8K9_9BACT|nr:hypothetical protein [Plebeiobacterium sediminum]MCW3789239.1 hypothetical protein [Plebeiobacterium sediminum]
MRKYILICCFIQLTFIAKSQSASVEKSVYGIQTGILGIWGHNEAFLSKSLALRSEIGFDSGIWGGTFYEKTGFLMTPVLTLEPRYYYNLNKRERKTKRIDGNTGNFLSLKTSYHPDWFVISNYSNISIISDISIVPTWGIRRSIGKHINFETGFGIGYQHVFAKQAGYYQDENYVLYNVHLRIGYRFNR